MEPSHRLKRGRPAKVNSEDYVETVLKFKNRVLQDNRVVPASDSVWDDIALALGNQVKSSSVHALTVSNRHNLLKKLLGENMPLKAIDDFAANDNFDDSNKCDSSLPKEYHFTLTFGKVEFSELLNETSYYVSTNGQKKKLRRYTVLQQQKWTEMMARKIYDECRLQHAFNFKTHYIFRDGSSGSCKGYCACGSVIRCTISAPEQERSVKIFCAIKEGDKECGKRQLRSENRQKVAQDLQKTSVFAYRNEEAARMTEKGDENLRFLHNASVLRNAKYEYTKSQYLDPDPRKALSLLKRSTTLGKNVIHDIGFDPIYVHFWSNHQIKLYNAKVAEKGSFLAIDATGKVAPKIVHVDSLKSHHLFLYTASLMCRQYSFPVSRQISECHDAVSIGTWLKKWLKSGAKYPPEVVCDESRALLNAITCALTPFLSIEDYANACNPQEEIMPYVYIRNDCAHIMNTWARFLKKNVRPRIKEFYLIAIGTLVICQDLKTAKALIKAILLLASSETIGDRTKTLNFGENLITKLATEETPNFVEIKNLIHKILNADNDRIADEVEDSDIESDAEFEDLNKKNESGSPFKYDKKFSWRHWGLQIGKEVATVLKLEEGDKDNPRVCPAIATYLLKKIETLPLWSNICRNKFGYGRVPASSAHIESEFNLIKSHILNKTQKRLDVLVETLIVQDKGRLAILESEASIPSKLQVVDVYSNSSMDISSNYEGDGNSANTTEKFQEEFRSEFRYQGDEANHLSGEENKENFLTDIYFQKDDECGVCKTQITKPTFTCVVCKDIMHDACGEEIQDNDEYEQHKICQNCFTDEDKDKRLALQSCENWMGMGITKEKKSQLGKYLGSNKQGIKDALTFHKYCKIPLLRNGSSMGLEFIKLNNCKFTISNTCAFDSIFQVLLAAAVDHSTLKVYFTSECTKNTMFNLITHTMEFLSDFLLMQPNFKSDVIKEVINNISRCGICKTWNASWNILEIGMILAIEIGETQTSQSITLDMIPLNIYHQEYQFKLIGLVSYKGENSSTRCSTSIGHYTGLALRKNNRWVEYDDLKEKAASIAKPNHKIRPALLMYIKQTTGNIKST